MTFEEILAQYALPVVCMAAIVMVLVGFIKIFTKMIPGEDSKLTKVMSYLYVIFTAGFSFGISCLYFHVFNIEFAWLEIAKYSATVFGCTQALYPIYRDYGGRYLLEKFLSLFKGKSKKADDVIKLINEVIALTDKQKEALKDKLK